MESSRTICRSLPAPTLHILNWVRGLFPRSVSAVVGKVVNILVVSGDDELKWSSNRCKDFLYPPKWFFK